MAANIVQDVRYTTVDLLEPLRNEWGQILTIANGGHTIRQVKVLG